MSVQHSTATRPPNGRDGGTGGTGHAAPPVIVVVDDDDDVRAALDSLLRSAGLATRVYGSAQEFFAAPLPDSVCCLVVDLLMPKVSGLEMQAELRRRGIAIPIVFVSGHADIPTTVRAMKAGALDVLPKPPRDQDLLDAVHDGVRRHRIHRQAQRDLARLRASYQSLTPREREVMALVVRGLLNKQIAGELGLSEITIKLHRANMLRKMGTRSVAGLVRMAETLARAAG